MYGYVTISSPLSLFSEFTKNRVSEVIARGFRKTINTVHVL